MDREVLKQLRIPIPMSTQALFPVSKLKTNGSSEKIYIIPPARNRYLAEISETIRKFNKDSHDQAEIAQKLYGLHLAIIEAKKAKDDLVVSSLEKIYLGLEEKLSAENKKIIKSWEEKVAKYKAEIYTYQVRGKDIKVAPGYKEKRSDA